MIRSNTFADFIHRFSLNKEEGYPTDMKDKLVRDTGFEPVTPTVSIMRLQKLFTEFIHILDF